MNQTIIFRFYVNLQGCNFLNFNHVSLFMFLACIMNFLLGLAQPSVANLNTNLSPKNKEPQQRNIGIPFQYFQESPTFVFVCMFPTTTTTVGVAFFSMFYHVLPR